MKKLIFSAIVVSVAFLFAACNGGDDPQVVQRIYLSPEAVQLAEVGATQQLTVTFYPAGTSAAVTWMSTNTAHATVDANGLVTGVASGTAMIVASVGTITASVPVTVAIEIPGTFDPRLLQGTEYFPIVVDATTRAVLGDRIVADFAPNDMYRWLWIWDETYVGGPPTIGNSFFGHAGESWMSFAVASGPGWSGKGYFIGSAVDQEYLEMGLAQLNLLGRMMDNPTEWYFHIAVKSFNAAVSHMIGFDGLNIPGTEIATTGRFVVGLVPFVDLAGTFQPHPNARVAADGEWHSIVIPFTYLMNYAHPSGVANNLRYGTNNTHGRNFMFTLSGGTAGAVLQYDAAFFFRSPVPMIP